MSNLAFFINQLDQLDPKLYEPLWEVTWGRDINLRPDVQLGQKSTSYVRSTFGSPGSQSALGQPWLAQNGNNLPGVSVDGEQVVTPVRELGREVSYTSIELATSQRTSQNIDVQKYNGLNIMYQMGTDQMVYTGDPEVEAYGLVNSPLVTSGTVANGVSLATEWVDKTPDEILADINTLLESTWTATGQTTCPNKLLIPSAQYALISGLKVSQAADKSVLTYVQENSLSTSINGVQLDIKPSKYLTSAGAGGSSRMVAYTNREDLLRFPMVPIQRQTPYFVGISYNCPYVWAYGEVEFVYPESIQYADGI